MARKKINLNTLSKNKKKQVSLNISRLITKKKYPQKQAVAIAASEEAYGLTKKKIAGYIRPSKKKKKK